jgi:hypothetical protein
MKLCNRCHEEKPMDDYYKNQHRCKTCDSRYRKELWHCEICDREYRRKNRKLHLRSFIHLRCLQFHQRNTFMPKQRKVEHVDNVKDEEDVKKEITDEMVSKILEIIKS